jgi:hypothetical protein
MDCLIGHLVGDYILQNDWQAANKLYVRGKMFKTFTVAQFHGMLWAAAIAWTGWFADKPWPGWAIVLMGVLHGLQDWARTAPRLMARRKQFVYFKEQLPQAYVWATIVVDNTLHLLMLFMMDVWIRGVT